MSGSHAAALRRSYGRRNGASTPSATTRASPLGWRTRASPKCRRARSRCSPCRRQRESTITPAVQPDNLQVSEQPLGDGHLIDARGEIDHVTTPLVADALRRATLDGGGPVVLDLTETTFIDSAGISPLLNRLRR